MIKRSCSSNFQRICLVGLCGFLSAMTQAAITSPTELIRINSDQQQFDLQKNVAVLIGNVVIIQGELKINADKTTISQIPNVTNQQFVEATGKPVKFTHVLKNGKRINGHADTLTYNSQIEVVTLIGDALVTQAENNIKSPVITYYVKEEKMVASSKNGNRVATVLLPSSLGQNKTNKK